MIPYKTIISLNRNSNQALYLQLANQLIELIKKGNLATGSPLPSSRKLAFQLEIHRKTVLATYNELILQGWLITKPQKGTYVNEDIPVLQKRDFKFQDTGVNYNNTNFNYYKEKQSDGLNTAYSKDFMYINDGGI